MASRTAPSWRPGCRRAVARRRILPHGGLPPSGQIPHHVRFQPDLRNEELEPEDRRTPLAPGAPPRRKSWPCFGPGRLASATPTEFGSPLAAANGIKDAAGSVARSGRERSLSLYAASSSDTAGTAQRARRARLEPRHDRQGGRRSRRLRVPRPRGRGRAARKEQARKNAIQALNDIDWAAKGKTVSVRINGLDTHYMYRDVVDVMEQAGDRVRHDPGAQGRRARRPLHGRGDGQPDREGQGLPSARRA